MNHDQQVSARSAARACEGTHLPAAMIDADSQLIFKVLSWQEDETDEVEDEEVHVENIT